MKAQILLVVFCLLRSTSTASSLEPPDQPRSTPAASAKGNGPLASSHEGVLQYSASALASSNSVSLESDLSLVSSTVSDSRKAAEETRFIKQMGQAGTKNIYFMRCTSKALDQRTPALQGVPQKDRSQSKFQNYTDLAAAGLKATSLSKADHFTVSTGFPIKRLVQDMHWQYTSHGSASKVRHTVELWQGTGQNQGLSYTLVYAPEIGVLYTKCNLNPQGEASGARDLLRRWSDVAALSYIAQAKAIGSQAKTLRYIVAVQCGDADTVRVANNGVSWNAGTPGLPPSPGRFGGGYKQFFPTTGYATSKAFLGMPIGQRVTTLLAQHKDPGHGFGLKWVSRILMLSDDTVKDEADFANYKGPTLVFELNDVPPTKVITASEAAPTSVGDAAAGVKRPAPER